LNLLSPTLTFIGRR